MVQTQSAPDLWRKQLDIAATVARVTSANIKASANRYFDPKHYVLGVMKPVSK